MKHNHLITFKELERKKMFQKLAGAYCFPSLFNNNEVYKKDRLEIPRIQENSKNVARLKNHTLRK